MVAFYDYQVGRSMRRREFITLLGGAAVGWPVGARAQQAGGMPTIGVLWHAGSPDEEQPYFGALNRGFKDLGYVEGHNVKFEHRFPNETPDRFRTMAAELVALKVVVIVTVGNATAPYAKNATSTIPVVFIFVADPVGLHLVDSLARPGGNITGLAQLGTDLAAKRFELLRDIVPQLSRVALLYNPGEPSGDKYLKEGQAAAITLGLTVMPFELRSLDQTESVFGSMAQAGVQAVSLGPGGLIFQGRDRLQKAALAYRMPTCGWSRETLVSGLLLSYGPDQVEMAHHVPVLVDKILHGVKPSDIPIEQPTQFQLIVNQRTAKALNIKIPESRLLRADEVVE
jgi:putative tryptophan/tyrosine transport system substrate-binding protein